MNKEPYLISVIIPTRNRQKYAKAAVNTILSLGNDIQIIVQDNSNDHLLKQLLYDVIDNDRVIYHYIENKIAGVDNYNLAAQYATGKYFCAIGDDDTVLPEIIDCAQWMEKNDIDIVLPSKLLTYFWPKTNNDIKTKHSFLGIGSFSGKVEKINPVSEIEKLLKNGGQHYLQLKLPGSYHCLVKTSCMKEVQITTGKYYGGLSPDMFSVVCLSLLPNIKAVYLDYPISLPGVCPKSTSAESDSGKHIGRLEDAPHFVGLIDYYKWDESVPKIYSVQTIWCETMIHAIKAMKREELIGSYFSREALISYLYYENIRDKDFIWSNLDNHDRQLINKKYSHKNHITLSRIYYLFMLVIGRRYRSYNCPDIEYAVRDTNKWLNKSRHKKAKRHYINKNIDWRQ